MPEYGYIPSLADLRLADKHPPLAEGDVQFSAKYPGYLILRDKNENYFAKSLTEATYNLGVELSLNYDVVQSRTDLRTKLGSVDGPISPEAFRQQVTRLRSAVDDKRLDRRLKHPTKGVFRTVPGVGLVAVSSLYVLHVQEPPTHDERDPMRLGNIEFFDTSPYASIWEKGQKRRVKLPSIQRHIALTLGQTPYVARTWSELAVEAWDPENQPDAVTVRKNVGRLRSILGEEGKKVFRKLRASEELAWYALESTEPNARLCLMETSAPLEAASKQVQLSRKHFLASAKGNEVELTPQEFRVLARLMEKPHFYHSPETLASGLEWSTSYYGVAKIVANLKKKTIAQAFDYDPDRGYAIAA
jgi:DNA-binding response OmpR family regulator